MSTAQLVDPSDFPVANSVVIIDCRFALMNGGEGRQLYEQGHIPGAHYLDLNRDLSGTAGAHGGRHPLPEADDFARTLAGLGIGLATQVIAYDDSHLAFSSRLWWMMRSLGYRPPQLLNGGFRAWLAAGGPVDIQVPDVSSCEAPSGLTYSGLCDIDAVRAAQTRGALLVDSREQRRYEGLEEPMDPVAGHIPGAVNRPWQGVTTDSGYVLPVEAQKQHLGEVLDAREVVVYCGSGVTACVNLFSLAMAGREDPVLYGGSWSDWCSYLPNG